MKWFWGIVSLAVITLIGFAAVWDPTIREAVSVIAYLAMVAGFWWMGVKFVGLCDEVKANSFAAFHRDKD